MNEQAKSAAEELDVNMNSQQGNSGQSKKKSKSKIVAIAAVLVAVVVVAAITGCSAEETSAGSAEETSGEETKTVALEWLSIEVPEDWTVEYEESYDGSVTYISIAPDDFDGLVFIQGPFEVDDFDLEAAEAEANASYLTGYGYDVTTETFNEDSAVILRASYVCEDFDEYEASEANTSYIIVSQDVYSGNEYISVECDSGTDDDYEAHAEELEDVLDSMTLDNPSAPE